MGEAGRRRRAHKRPYGTPPEVLAKLSRGTSSIPKKYAVYPPLPPARPAAQILVLYFRRGEDERGWNGP